MKEPKLNLNWPEDEGKEYYVVDNGEVVWTVFDDHSTRDKPEFETEQEAHEWLKKQ